MKNIIVSLLCALLIPVSNGATPEEDALKGMDEFAAGNLIRAMDLLYSSARAGSAVAQSQLGYILDQSEENEEAAEWFFKAAQQNNADGQYGLGKMYAKGEGVEKQPNDALHWIRLAAEQEHVAAMRTLGSAHEKGDLGLSVDYEETVIWFYRAAMKGDSVAIQRLTDAYQSGELGLQIDLQQAKFWRAQIPGE